jgi:hypothetical protein
LFDVRDFSDRITVGNGKTTEATNAMQVNENTFKVLLHEFNFVPELWVNLYSDNMNLKNGFNIWNEDMIIHIEGLKYIVF